MAGMKGFVHKCDKAKCNISSYKNSINDTKFSDLEIKRIWEFYVTKSPAEQSSRSISLENYGWDKTNSKESGFPALEDALIKAADNSKWCFVRARTIKDTLAAMDLSGENICIDHSRAVLMQDFQYIHDEDEQVRIDSKEGRIRCLFRHVRNSFAHGNTYFFDNDMVMFEDKESGSSRRITARILIPQKALLSWISIVDKEHLLPIVEE